MRKRSQLPGWQPKNRWQISNKNENFQLVSEFLPRKVGLLWLKQLSELDGLADGAQACPQNVVRHPGFRTEQVEETIRDCALQSVTHKKQTLGPVAEFALCLVSQYVERLSQIPRSRGGPGCYGRDCRR